ncbi:MAG: hypothetical protein HMLKMBBP_02238 [Planctomycetes bacterium]|nr:hypothetical protein [Planctomycetota bacterium]
MSREPVTVPAWERGREVAEMTSPRRLELAMLGLGNSVGTPEGGIEAEVVVARDFDHLESLGERCRGRIVLFDRPMAAFDAATQETGYGPAVAYRAAGPSRAAKLGAVACLVRSVTATSLRTPHTGMLSYDPAAPKIPAAAVSVEDAERIHRLVAGGETVRVRLSMEARFRDPALSANVVADLRGSELPEEIVLLGAHLDSWDVGQGAQDDGGGCVAVVEAARLVAKLGLRPRRTIRVVLFTNEENGLAGAHSYAARHREEAERHVAAIEADSGTARVMGFTSPAPKPGDERSRAARARIADALAATSSLGPLQLRDGGGGADIAPLQNLGVPVAGLMVDMSRYFDVHHTHADTLDKVDRGDLADCAALLAITAWTLADAPPDSTRDSIRDPTPDPTRDARGGPSPR